MAGVFFTRISSAKQSLAARRAIRRIEKTCFPAREQGKNPGGWAPWENPGGFRE